MIAHLYGTELQKKCVLSKGCSSCGNSETMVSAIFLTHSPYAVLKIFFSGIRKTRIFDMIPDQSTES